MKMVLPLLKKTKKPWLTWVRRILGAIITAAIFVGILHPVFGKWGDVHQRIVDTNLRMFILAAIFFAIFLFVFRAMAWRHIINGFGHQLPMAASVRIWSTSELARYLPGVVWQVIGRVYLVRPYGISTTECSASQVLELTIFLLANILMAVICFVYLGVRNMAPEARPYLYCVMIIAPFLLLILQPKFFYGTLNRFMAAMGKPAIINRLTWGHSVGLVLWSMLGLLLQSLAIFLVVHEPLHLRWVKWWTVAGSYCLAWCGGFLAFWAPGGLGVREFIFIYAMRITLPRNLIQNFSDETTLRGFLAFLGVLLRLWATLGELLLAAMAYMLDYRGALGRADAPGRMLEVIDQNTETPERMNHAVSDKPL